MKSKVNKLHQKNNESLSLPPLSLKLSFLVDFIAFRVIGCVVCKEYSLYLLFAWIALECAVLIISNRIAYPLSVFGFLAVSILGGLLYGWPFVVLFVVLKAALFSVYAFQKIAIGGQR